MVDRKELIKKYLEFFKSKDHKIISNTSLIPENDPTALFISAGMHPLVPFLLGQPHPSGKRLCNVQKCIRTTDIEEVGDETHHTFFEMLGNWSLGDYWKEDSIKYSFEFLTKELKISKEKLAVTIFAGEKDTISADQDSKKLWEKLKISKITLLRKEDNWWGPVGTTGPCGPDTEIFCWNSKNPVPEKFNPNDSTLATSGNKWVEIWNNVFMECNKTSKGKFEPLKQKNVDTGMGVERTVAILNRLEDNYLADMWKPIIEEIEEISKKPYKGNERAMRIIADHIKAAVFIIADGFSPSNTEQGYVLRRLIRKAVRYGRELKIKNFVSKVAKPVFKIYLDYPELKKNKKRILEELKKEEKKFLLTLEKGLKELKKMALKIDMKDKINGKNTFLLFQSYGFPIEMTKEVALREWGADVDVKGFEQELKKHQQLSRTSTAGRFKSGLADNSELTTKLHTAAHLLLQALKIVLKDNSIIQKGSNITSERLRLDFSFPRKLEEDEIRKVEDLVNSQVQNSCEVIREEMSPKQARKEGACGIFDKKYGDKISVYSIGNFSKEICAGPHVKNTCELGRFKIKKEESVGAGARRIKATLE